jgi:hypothetical protein
MTIGKEPVKDRLKIISHPSNRGKGAALWFIFRYRFFD